jgi:cytochrome c oxidase assembly factor CtaG
VRTLAFVLLGVGSYLFIDLGFFGVYSQDLRWAFTSRIALLLFVVPMLLSIGRPLSLGLTVMRAAPRRRLREFLNSRFIRLISNAIFAPLFSLALFMFFITPLSGVIRENSIAQHAISTVIPVFGLLMFLPLVSNHSRRTSLFISAEFMIAFVELMLDAIPGVILSISDTVQDGLVNRPIGAPSWFGTALSDQHFSGNLLWMIAELGDVPILVMLFIRWQRHDRKDQKTTDVLSDEQYEELVAEHLKRR